MGTQAAQLSAWNRTRGVKALRLVETTDLSREDWLQVRRAGIGGSDIAGILGISPFSTPLEVYAEKVMEIQSEESEAMHWGNMLEPVIASEFALRHPEYRVEAVNAVLQDQEVPHFLTNVDRLLIGSEANAILEVKNTSEYLRKLWEDENTPDYYMTQAQWYMGVAGLPCAWVAVLIGGNKYVERYIKRDDDLIAILRNRADEFWQNNVLAGVAPEPTAKDKDILNKIFTRTYGETVDLPEGTAALCTDLLNINEKIKDGTQLKEYFQNRLKHLLGSAEVGYVSDRFEVYWAPDKNGTRRFRLKEIVSKTTETKKAA